MSILNVKSEIGQLKTVLLHEPNGELENLTPKHLDELLFDDIPWLPLAIKEHQAFAKVLKNNGVEVLYLVDLVCEALDQSPTLKNQFINQFIDESHLTSEPLIELVTNYLLSFKTTKEMVSKTMAGIKKTDIPNFTKTTLTDYIRDYPFITDPMPNLYFTRDPFTIIGNGVSINKMYSITRCRETIYSEYIFKYHPKYSDNIKTYYNRDDIPNIEGGDILVLNSKVIIVGISQRTHPSAIEKLAYSLLTDTCSTFEKVLAFDIPKNRSFMHLDTVLTQVDYDKFTIHPDCYSNLKIFELTLINKKIKVTPLEEKLEIILENILNKKITLIPCGGVDSISSDREQWSDGANTVAIAPGVVVVYERNHITNEILKSHGIKVYTIPSSELSRGRGGPRCMCMPLYRENIKY